MKNSFANRIYLMTDHPRLNIEPWEKDDARRGLICAAPSELSKVNFIILSTAIMSSADNLPPELAILGTSSYREDKQTNKQTDRLTHTLESC